jgi:hypothetical protein
MKHTLFVTVVLVMASAARALEQEPAPTALDETVAGLVRALESLDFAEREGAQKKLEELPVEALDTVKNAIHASNDLEAKLRGGQVVERLAGRKWTDENRFVLPHVYRGTYAWRGSPDDDSQVTLTIQTVRLDPDGDILFDGTITYLGGLYQMRLSARLKPATLVITMTESQANRADAVTDGSHLGTISKDLSAITTVWTTESTGTQGDLRLNAP